MIHISIYPFHFVCLCMQLVNSSGFISAPTEDQVQQFIDSMVLPQAVVIDIEETTRSQADSDLWLALHNGRITSSRFGEVQRRQDTTSPKALVKAIMGYKRQFFSTPAMKWGLEHEDIARQLYIKDRAQTQRVNVSSCNGTNFMPKHVIPRSFIRWSCHMPQC